MQPVLDKKCPKCGFLTLAKSDSYEYCMYKFCNYSDKNVIKQKIDFSKLRERSFDVEEEPIVPLFSFEDYMEDV